MQCLDVYHVLAPVEWATRGATAPSLTVVMFANGRVDSSSGGGGESSLLAGAGRVPTKRPVCLRKLLAADP